MTTIRLGDVPVWESADVPIGKFIGSEFGLWAHPLDAIALRYPRAMDRIAPAMEWILGQALRRLDRAVPTSPISSTEERIAEGPNEWEAFTSCFVCDASIDWNGNDLLPLTVRPRSTRYRQTPARGAPREAARARRGRGARPRLLLRRL